MGPAAFLKLGIRVTDKAPDLFTIKDSVLSLIANGVSYNLHYLFLYLFLSNKLLSKLSLSLADCKCQP